MTRLENDLLGSLEGVVVVHTLVNVSSPGITTSVGAILIYFRKTIAINGQLGELALHKQKEC
jgi:hypothetical protein